MDGKAEPEPEPEHGVSFGAGARMSAVLVAAGRSSVHGGDGGPRPGAAAHARKQHLFPSSKQNDDIFSHLEIRRV